MPENPPAIRFEPLKRLRFDPENPRLPESVAGANRREVIHWMLQDASLTDLMRSIATQGFFVGEPLLVYPSPGEDEYIVVEGNRRLAAVLLLNKPELAPTRKRSVANIADEASHTPTELPVVVFDERAEILDYLGYRHVTGVKAWEPIAKARYIASMWDRLHSDFPDEPTRLRRIANLIGSRSDYVARTLTGLEVYRSLVRSGFIGRRVSHDDVDFSLLIVALGRPSIVTWLGLESGQDYTLAGMDESRLALLAQWLYERDDEGQTVLGESRNITKLASVVEDEDAVQTLLRNGSLDRAARQTSYASEDLLSHLYQARGALQSALEVLGDVTAFDAEDLSLLKEIARVNKRLYDALSGISASVEDLV